MPELAFLDAVASFLSGAALVPAPAQIGISQPTNENNQVPAIILALEDLDRPDTGLGGGAEPMKGVLPVHASVDLANPFLPGDSSFRLVSEDRLGLILPHGGLIRADGTEGELSSSDIAVQVAGTPQALVAADPGPNQFTVDPLIGELSFGVALPATGMVQADYSLGQWERTVASVAGTLLLAVRAAQAGDVATLSNAAIRALLNARARNAFAGLKNIRLVSLGSVALASEAMAGHRERLARLEFMFDHIVDAAASSGGVIHEIPITSVLESLRLDPGGRLLVEEREREPS